MGGTYSATKPLLFSSNYRKKPNRTTPIENVFSSLKSKDIVFTITPDTMVKQRRATCDLLNNAAHVFWALYFHSPHHPMTSILG